MKRIGLVLCIAFLLASCNTTTSTQETFKIGTIIPLTGSGANLGTSTLKAMELAVDEINSQGGVNGHELRLISQDSKLDGKASASAANYLLNVEDVDVVTVLFHLPAQAVSPIVKEAGRPLIYEAFTRSMVAENPLSFKAHFDALTGCEELVRYAKEHGKYDKLGVLLARAEYGELCLEGVKKVESEIEVYRYTFGDTDFRTLFAKANREGVDTLLTMGIDFEFINMFKQLTELGYPIKMMCATATECIFPDVKEVASPDVLEGTLAIDFIPLNLAQTEFGEEYAARYGDISDISLAYAAVGYEEVKFLAEAMESCEPGNSECLVNSLGSLSSYDSLIDSQGFKGRILQVKNSIYEYRDGEFAKLE